MNVHKKIMMYKGGRFTYVNHSLKAIRNDVRYVGKKYSMFYFYKIRRIMWSLKLKLYEED